MEVTGTHVRSGTEDLVTISTGNLKYIRSANASDYPLAVSFTIGTLGLVTNVFTLIVLIGFAKIKHGPSTILLINQTVTDTVCCTLLLLTKGLQVTDLGKLTGIWGEFVCRVVFSQQLLWGSFNASSFSLVSITLERYLVVVHPAFHRNHFSNRLVRILIILGWSLGFLCVLPVLPIFMVKEGVCVTKWHPWSSDLAYVITTSIVTFIFPITFLTFAYGRMIWVLRKRNKAVRCREPRTANKTVMSKSQLNTTITMIAIAVVYIICVTPYQIYVLATVIGQAHDTNVGSSLNITLIVWSLLNCCINPFIYGIKYEAFKSGVRRMLKLMSYTSVTSTEEVESSH